MPKRPTARQTTDQFGKKLLAVMEDRKLDIPGLAAVFDVKPASVYDWIDHGRFGKARFGKLVEWSGRSLHWWFDLPEMPGKDRARTVDETTAHERYRIAAQYMDKLFPRVDLDRLSSLEPELLAKLEDGLLVAAGVHHVDIQTAEAHAAPAAARRKHPPRSA